MLVGVTVDDIDGVGVGVFDKLLLGETVGVVVVVTEDVIVGVGVIVFVVVGVGVTVVVLVGVGVVPGLFGAGTVSNGLLILM